MCVLNTDHMYICFCWFFAVGPANGGKNINVISLPSFHGD